MAVFLETLADTAVVAEACEQARMGLSGAYALRRRNAYFATAWDAALGLARDKLADTLLARSMEGNVEQIWRGGEIVGERHVIDNRLGLAILRRLDRLAETGLAVHNVSPSIVRPRADQLSPCAPPAIDWDQALDALRSGDPDAISHALATVQGNKVDEVEDPSIRPRDGYNQGDNERDNADDSEPREIDLSDRCWLEDEGDPDLRRWMTDFPPPAGFAGEENRAYDENCDDRYERECTSQEIAILDADLAAHRAAERADDEQLRDAWFELLRPKRSAPKKARRQTRAKSRAKQCAVSTKETVSSSP